jgi:hypothetical protein
MQTLLPSADTYNKFVVYWYICIFIICESISKHVDGIKMLVICEWNWHFVMFYKEESDYVTGVYRCKDCIKNFKIR